MRNLSDSLGYSDGMEPLDPALGLASMSLLLQD